MVVITRHLLLILLAAILAVSFFPRQLGLSAELVTSVMRGMALFLLGSATVVCLAAKARR